ncbi:hypothetical protein B425_0398 [Bacillus amyloliquefaciens]|nr:hypothetical protein B425_0398 [Bacillus amyloliquefaciens]
MLPGKVYKTLSKNIQPFSNGNLALVRVTVLNKKNVSDNMP